MELGRVVNDTRISCEIQKTDPICAFHRIFFPKYTNAKFFLMRWGEIAEFLFFPTTFATCSKKEK